MSCPIPRALVAAAALSAAVVQVACGSDKKQAPAAAPGGAAAAATSGPAAAPSVNVPGGPCYLRELWDECTLIKRLESQGYVPKVDGRNAGKLATAFTAPSVELLLGRGRLRAFLYASEAAATADLARADTVGQSACPAPPNAKYAATLLHSGNLIALLEAGNDNTCIRVGDLIRAGLPKYERR